MPSHRRLKGKGIGSFFKKANSWLKKTQIVSKLGNAYAKYGGMLGAPQTANVGRIAGMAGQMGYGRRRKRRTKRIVGSGLRLAGGRRTPMHF